MDSTSVKRCPFCFVPIAEEALLCASCDRMPVSWRTALELTFETARSMAAYPGLSKDRIGQIADSAVDTVMTFARRFAAGYRVVTIAGPITAKSAQATVEVFEDSAPNCWNMVIVDAMGGDPFQADKIRVAIDGAKRRGSLESMIIVNATGAGLLCALGQSVRICLSSASIGDLKDCGLSVNQIGQRINHAKALQSKVTPSGRLVNTPPATEHLVETFLAGKVISAESAEASNLVSVITPSLNAAELVAASIIGRVMES